MNDPETILKKRSLNQVVNDLNVQDKLYAQLDRLWSELDDHKMNGRTVESNRTFNEILKVNREITVTENRCRSRLGLKKL